MVDPPPYSSNALRSRGIPPYIIEKIIITHCHADHDAGAFHKLIQSTPVEFLTTYTVYNSFIKKSAAICGVDIPTLENLFQFRPVFVGHPTYILGAKFMFNYSFHSIPALSFDV